MRLSERMLVIAQHSGDWQMLGHALHIIAVQRVNVGDYDKALELADEIWQLFLQHDSLPFVVNPLAPIDPGLSSRCVMAMAHCVLGRMEQAVEDVDTALAYAERNGEPFNHQFILGMHCFILLQLDKLEVQPERLLQYSVYAAAEPGGQSTLYEIVTSLFQAAAEPDDTLFIVQAAERCWSRYESGHRFFIAFNSPLCQLLLLAGKWSEGLSFCAIWRRLSHDGLISQFFPDCLRYEAMFLLQQAEAVIEEEQLLQLQQAEQRESSGGPAELDERQLSFESEVGPVFLQRPLSDPLPLTSAGSPSSALAAVSPPIPDTGESVASSSSSSGSSSAVESQEPSRSASPHPVDVWQLREEARVLLNESIAFAFRQGVRLLEMKAVMTVIPLLRFLAAAAAAQQHSMQPFDSPHQQPQQPVQQPTSPLSAAASNGHSRHRSLPLAVAGGRGGARGAAAAFSTRRPLAAARRLADASAVSARGADAQQGCSARLGAAAAASHCGVRGRVRCARAAAARAAGRAGGQRRLRHPARGARHARPHAAQRYQRHLRHHARRAQHRPGSAQAAVVHRGAELSAA